MCHILGKIGPIYGTKNAHGKIHGLKKRILEYILSRYFIVIKYLHDKYKIYKNCIFSRLFKKFWWEKYGANYGQNLPNLCAIFCPWCFLHSKFLNFNSHSHTGVIVWILLSLPVHFNSHSYAGVITRLAPKIILLHDSFSYPV